ncbi:unnamed protein product [Urochloa humidicola]
MPCSSAPPLLDFAGAEAEPGGARELRRRRPRRRRWGQGKRGGDSGRRRAGERGGVPGVGAGKAWLGAGAGAELRLARAAATPAPPSGRHGPASRGQALPPEPPRLTQASSAARLSWVSSSAAGPPALPAASPATPARRPSPAAGSAPCRARGEREEKDKGEGEKKNGMTSGTHK